MSEDNESQDDDDGITIKINSDDTESDENNTSDNEVSTSHTDNDDSEGILDEDGTVVVDGNYDGSVRLVGTVHVSKKTKDRVLDTIQEEEPDTVAIELDEERVYSMFERQADVIGGEAVEQGESGLRELIRQQQENQFDTEDMLKPGEADMIPAALEGIEQQANVAMVDMAVDQLKQNVIDNAYDEDGNIDLEIFNKSFGEIVQSVRGLAESRADMAEKLQEDGFSAVVDKLENSSLDEVKGQMDPLRDVAPEVIEALIDQRDQYMAGRIHWLRKNGHDTVGVMGRGHLEGVYDYLQNPETIDEEHIVEPDWYDYTVVDIN